MVRSDGVSLVNWCISVVVQSNVSQADFKVLAVAVSAITFDNFSLWNHPSDQPWEISWLSLVSICYWDTVNDKDLFDLYFYLKKRFHFETFFIKTSPFPSWASTKILPVSQRNLYKHHIRTQSIWFNTMSSTTHKSNNLTFRTLFFFSGGLEYHRAQICFRMNRKILQHGSSIKNQLFNELNYLH